MNQLVASNSLFALYAIPDSDCETVHAISFNRQSLQDILENKVPEEYKEIVTFKIKPIQVFLLTRLIKPNDEMQNIFNCFGTNKDLSIMPTTMINLKTFTNKIFGFNKLVTNDNYLQSLLLIPHDSKYDSDEYKEHLKYIREQHIFKNNISENPLNLDVFYDESILNV
jgi:hypothetical protein